MDQGNGGNMKRRLIFRIKRFDPESERFIYRDYEVEVDKYSTVLDVLIKIVETQDPTLSVRYSCRMGICGSCGMVVNGKPVLACEKNVLSIGSDVVTVEPMYNLPVIKDLVTDLEDFFEKHRKVKPWLIRADEDEQFNPKAEYIQYPEELERYWNFSYCIKCGLCVAACPIVAERSDFLGPQALAQAFRWYEDSRDQYSIERLDLVDSEQGVWGCEFAGSCSRACPKGVDPALAIQLLKMEIMGRTMGFRMPSIIPRSRGRR